MDAGALPCPWNETNSAGGWSARVRLEHGREFEAPAASG